MGGLVFTGQLYPSEGGSPALPNFGGSLIIMYAYTLYRRTTKFDAVTHMESGLVFRRSIMVQPLTGGAPALPNFAGFLSMTAL